MVRQEVLSEPLGASEGHFEPGHVEDFVEAPGTEFVSAGCVELVWEEERETAFLAELPA